MSLNSYAAEHHLAEETPGRIFLDAVERGEFQSSVNRAINAVIDDGDLGDEMDRILVEINSIPVEDFDFNPSDIAAESSYEAENLSGETNISDVNGDEDARSDFYHTGGIFLAIDIIERLGFTEEDDFNTIKKRLQDLASRADQIDVLAAFSDTESSEIKDNQRPLIAQAIRIVIDNLLKWVKND